MHRLQGYEKKEIQIKDHMYFMVIMCINQLFDVKCLNKNFISKSIFLIAKTKINFEISKINNL